MPLCGDAIKSAHKINVDGERAPRKRREEGGLNDAEAMVAWASEPCAMCPMYFHTLIHQRVLS